MPNENPCRNCSCNGCHKRGEIEAEDCSLDPTQRQKRVIRNSDYSSRNIRTKKEASDVVEAVCSA